VAARCLPLDEDPGPTLHPERSHPERFDTDPVTGMIARVRLDIELPAGFPEKYRPALIRAAEQCAVKKHLESPPRFEISTTTSA